MPKTHLPFGKIVATPTPSGWSQAYGAGGLFLTISLVSEKEEHTATLGALGKRLINDLEAEFFTLEEKSLLGIKKAIENAFSQLPSDIAVSSAIAYVKDTVLYVFLLGSGSILLRRSGTTGTLLEEKDPKNNQLQSASGNPENGDLVVLQTLQFQSLIPHATLKDALQSETAEEIAEVLSPLVHGKEDGGAAAVFFTYLQIADAQEQEEEEEEDIPPAPAHLEPEKLSIPSPFPDEQASFPHPLSEAKPSRRKLPVPFFAFLSALSTRFARLTHRQRLLLSIAGILVLVLLISIIFTTANQNSQKAKAVFASTYEPAQQEFEEGRGLIGLNTPLAREHLEKAEDILKDTDEIPANSEEGKKIAALKKDIASSLAQVTDSKQATVTPADNDASKLLSVLLSTNNALFATQDDDNVYFLTEKEIGSVTKSDDAKKTLIENDDDWSKPAGVGTFLGNLYVLDKNDGILKFVKGSDGYGGKTSYLVGEKPDLSTATDMTIDSAIYVLFSNGEIAKFTKGAPDTFKVAGLDKPFSSPTRIYTTPDFSSTYVLDNGNGRVVQLGKDGTYQSQYSADILKKAKDFEVDETNKKIYILSGNKIYEMPLQ